MTPGKEIALLSSQPSPATSVEPQRASNANGVIALLLMVTIICVIGLALSYWTFTRVPPDIGVKKHEPLRVYSTIPSFTLTERSGGSISSENLNQGIWIADFIFTRCGGTCPTMSKSMATLQKSLSHIPQLYPPVRLVSFTVDPEWDTTERLEDYADRFDADKGGWLFLRGEYEEIQELAREGFKVGVQQGHDDPLEPIIHSQSLILVDPQGQIRGYYDGTDPAAIRLLIADVMRLNRELTRS